MGIFSKNESREYIELNDYYSKLNENLLKDSFLSKKSYLGNYNNLFQTVHELKLMDEKEVLLNWCKKNKTDYKSIKKLILFYDNTEKTVLMHNKKYIENHLLSDKEYLDKVLYKDDPNIMLDEEQRRVVLSDEDYTLVIAGAGAGKTTTIEAKVKYLIEKKQIDPERVLVVSFTKKATDELKERFNRLELPVNIATFHSVGYSLIRKNDETQYKIVDQGFMYNVIENYLLTKLDDEYFIKKILLFFASYLNIPFDSDNISLLFKELSANDNTTIKSEVSKILDEYQEAQTKRKITIRDERVRSLDECRIANFLYIKGIDYVYEPVYRYGFKDSTKPYCPDFLIKYNDKEIYLEHFGISEDGQNYRFNRNELETYKRHINDKILLHKEHGTKLIYTFSKYRDGRDLISHLEEQLINCGIQFDGRKDIEIYRQLAQKAEDKYFSKLILLICTFINRFKTNNFDIKTKFDEWQYSIKNERTKLFLEIAKQCFLVYEKCRIEDGAIDFEDMINYAINILDKKIAEHDLLPYDYIFVDEYQDISLQRFDLCEKLSRASNAKIIAVGDDWQSIFKFSGAQIDLFTKFKEIMGYADILKIVNTYRNSQELIDIAGEFVMANEKQIRKDLKSKKKPIKDPVILMSYDDSYDKDDKKHGPFYRLGEAIERSLDDIVARNGLDKSVLLIGRYNYEGKNLSKLEDFFAYNERRGIISKKYPQLNISFMTAHASKGVGRDNVIIINGKDDILGFPSKVEDDPVMKLVIKDDESIEFEEERRLFYVALTRTKNRVYIITPQFKTSKFILEIKDKFTNVILRGVDLSPIDTVSLKFQCPVCGYPLQKRNSNYPFLKEMQKLWICSNDPEICGFLTNDLNGNSNRLSISKCPKCFDGYLIVKPIRNKNSSNQGERMLGCTNYKKDNTGCNFSMYGRNFTQDKSKIIIDENGKFIRSDIKSEVNLFLKSVSNIYSHYANFKFASNALLDFMQGTEDKVIISYKLSSFEGYGVFKNKDRSYLQILIELLINLDVLSKSKNDKGYVIFIVNQDTINDEQALIIEEHLPKVSL